MNKSEVRLVVTIGKNLYRYAIYAPELVEIKEVSEVSSQRLKDLLTNAIQDYSIHEVVFYFLTESLLTTMIPWAPEFLVRPQMFINLFIEPILPVNHQLTEYHFWYDLPEYLQDTPLIAGSTAKIRPLQELLLSIKSNLLFTYLNEITETLHNYPYQANKFNAIIPSVNGHVAVAVVSHKNRAEFLSIVQYKEEVTNATLKKFRSFLILKLFNWSEAAASDYKILTPKYKPHASLKPTNKYYFILLLLAIILMTLLVFTIMTANELGKLREKSDELQQQHNKLSQLSSLPNTIPTKKLLPLLKSIDMTTPLDIYIQRVSTTNAQDNISTLLLSGKATSFIVLDNYISALKENQNVMNIDIVSSFEDKTAIPIVISFEIKINLKNVENINAPAN